MSRHTLTGLVILCALLGAGLGASLLSGPQSRHEMNAVLLPFSAREIRGVTLRWRGGAHAQLTRDGPRWRLVAASAPTGALVDAPTWRVDGAVLDAALAELELLTRAGRIRGATAAAAQGLAPPALSVQLDTAARSATLRFGDDADPRRVFIGMGEQVFLVQRRARDLWPVGVEGLVDRRAFEIAPRRTTGFAVLGVSVRREPRRWRVTPPDGLADPAVVEQLLALLRNVKQADREPGAPLSLTVADDTGERTLEARLPPHDLERVGLLARRLVSDRPTELRAAELERIELTQGAARLTLRRGEDGDWRLDGGIEAEPEVVSALIGGLHRLRARIAPADVAARFHPTGAGVAFLGGGAETAVEVGQKEGKSRLFRVRGDGATYLCDDDPFALLRVDALAFRRRVLWSLPAASIEAIALGRHELRRDEHFRWVRTGATTPAPSAREVASVLRELAQFPVARFLPGITAPPANADTLRIETIDGDTRTSHVATVVEEGATGPLVTIKGASAILDPRVFARLRKLLAPPR